MDIDQNKEHLNSIVSNAQPKIESNWKSSGDQTIITVQDPAEIEATVSCLKGQDLDILKIYQEHASEYEQSLKNISARKIQEFKNIKTPNYSEYNIGIAMLYILACVDNTIMLSSNKKEVFDISWEAVTKTLSNSGLVCRNCRRIRPFVESTGIGENFLRYIKYHLENCYSDQMNNDCSIAAICIFEYLLNTFKMAEFLLPFQRTALEPKIPPFNEYEPKYVHSKDHLVSRIQNIPIDDEITHIKVVKSEYPEVEKETIFQQIDFNTPKISRQEEMEKCMSQAKHDADYIIYLKRMKSQLHSNFQEYVRERLKIERESARKLKNPSKAFIKTITDVETRLCYIEQFIDVINQNEAFQFEEAEEKYYKLMMYNEFIKEMTNIKKFRGILKKAERDVIEEENQIKSRINSNNQKAMIDEGRKLLEEQLAALNNI